MCTKLICGTITKPLCASDLSKYLQNNFFENKCMETFLTECYGILVLHLKRCTHMIRHMCASSEYSTENPRVVV